MVSLHYCSPPNNGRTDDVGTADHDAFEPGREADIKGLMEQLQAAEQPDSGLLRTTTMRDINDPSLVYTLVVFESEEKARARENDPRRKKRCRP